MHCWRKALEPCIFTRFISPLRTLRTKPHRHRRALCSDDEEEKESIRTSDKENQEKHLRFYKSMGQHILANPRILDAIVRKSHVRPTDTVLEIGPGTGNLTLKLLECAKRVVAVEIDKRMVEVLHKRVAEQGLEDRLHVICQDALKGEFPKFDLVVANIPYGISSPLVAKLLFGGTPFRSATLLLQKEFAQRLLANPGDSEFNRLAVNVKLVAELEFVMDVSKREFLPCPKVDSSVVIIRPKAEIPNVDLFEWWAFTRMCFCKKNKTLGATFKQKKKVVELLRLSNEMACGEECRLNEDEDGGKESETDKEDCDSSFGLEMNVGLFRDKLVGILQSGCFEDKRPSKLSNEKLLHLLSLFNQAGVYFHDKPEPKDKHDLIFAASYTP